MRIFRTIIIIAAAAFLLPSPPEERMPVETGVEPPTTTEYLVAAFSAVADVRDFCTRQAAVCDTAHYAAVKLEGKAKYSFELLYQWASDKKGTTVVEQAYEGDPAAEDGFTGSTGAAETPGRNTLELEDLIPEWRAPRA